MFPTRGSNTYGQQPYAAQSGYGQNLGSAYSGSSIGGPDGGTQLSVASRHSSMLGGSQEADIGGYRGHPSTAAHYGGQYSSLYGSALSSSQQVPASAKGVGPSNLESRSGYASAMPESPKFTSSDYVSSSTHGYGQKGDQFFSEKLSEYPSVERRQYGERQSAYVGGRELQSESSGRYADPVGFSHQHQPEIYDRVDQASLLRQEQMLKAQSLQSTSLDGGARQTDYLAARSATIRHSTQDLMPYSGRLDGDPRNLSMLSGSSYGAQHAPSILGAAPRRNADDLMYAQSSSNPGYGVSLPPGRDYATGKGLHGTSLEPDFMSRGGHTRIDERKDDRGAYVRELELREEERRREHFREREKDREREKERQRERERERERAERERERERERKRILERREKERERERKRAAEVKHERTPLRISKDRHVSSLVKDERPTRRESPRHEALHRRHSPVKEKRREYACKVYSSSLVDVERDYLSLDKRYPKLFISPEFTKVVVNWPKGNLKLSFNTPVSFEHDFVEEESSPEQKEVSTEQLAEEPVESKHGSTVWNAKMILMSGLSKNALEDLSSEKCPDDRMPHICSILRFSVLKKDRSFMAIGGPWDDAVDGGDPSVDDSSLVQTIHRYAKDVTQLDLQNCQNWNRFIEIHYDRIGEDGFFSHKEVTVLFVPDLSECLPSLDTWRDQWLAHKKVAAERAGQLSLKKEKSKEKKEGLKDKETDSTKAVKQVDKSAKTKDSASSGQVDVNKKEKNGSQPKGDEAGIKGNGNTDKNIVKKDVVEMSQDGKSIEKKESEATAGSQSSNAKSGKKKIVKKVVKQKVADKNTATENTKNEENDKLDEKDVGEKNAKSETKGQQQEPSADPSVKTFIRKKVGKKVTEGKITQDESMQPEVKIENEPQCSEGKSEIKPDPSVAVSVQGTGVRTTIKKKIIKRIPKRKVTGVGGNTGSAESQKDGDSEEKKVVQLGTKNKNVSEKTVEAGNPACEPKILEKKMTPKTKSKTEIFSKQDEKTGSGTKIETEAEKQKVPQKDSQIGNSDRSKDQEKSKDEKEKKEKDGKFDSRGNKSDKEAKEKRNLEEPPRHPGLFLQTKWSKDSKLRALSLSLDSLLGYTDKDIEEPTFEVSLFAETLFEMLQYQMGSRLLTFLQKLRLRFVMKRNQRKRQREEPSEKGSKERSSAKRPKIAEPSMGMKSTESEMLDAAHLKEEKAATKGESASGDVVKIERPKEEGVESEKLEDEGAEMENTDDEIDYDEDPEEDPEEEPMEDEEMQDANHQDEHNEELNVLNNEGEAKTSGETEPEMVAGTEKEEAEGSCKEKTKNETAETNEGANPGEERKEAPVINKVSVDKELLQAFRFFDRNQVGYIRVEDMRLIIHSLGKFLSHRDVKELVQSALLESNTGRDDRILYNKLKPGIVEILKTAMAQCLDPPLLDALKLTYFLSIPLAY